MQRVDWRDLPIIKEQDIHVHETLYLSIPWKLLAVIRNQAYLDGTEMMMQTSTAPIKATSLDVTIRHAVLMPTHDILMREAGELILSCNRK